MDSGGYEQDMDSREVCANGVCMKTTDAEAKLDEGNIQEAESSLREGLSLNFEVRDFFLVFSQCCGEQATAWCKRWA